MLPQFDSEIGLISKQDIWPLFDESILADLGWKSDKIHLKTWQDIYLYEKIKRIKNAKIGEIGGGFSRILANLDGSNELFNIDKFEGAGNGPVEAKNIENVTILPCYVGSESKASIADEHFDVIFSVSVIEHITDENLNEFFQETHRFLKTGGLSIHMIDHYISTDEQTSIHEYNEDRYNKYVKFVEEVSDLKRRGPFKFTCDLATNPDQTMYAWNLMVPSLVEARLSHQSVSSYFIYTK